MVKNYAEWIIRFRWLVLLLSLMVAAALGYGAQYLTFTNDYRVFFSKENPQLLAFENLQDTYAKNDNVMMVLVPEDGDVFTAQTLRAVAWLTEQAWQIPWSRRVDSLTNFQHTEAHGDDLAAQRHVELGNGLDGFHRSEFIPGRKAVAGLRQFHEDDVAQLILGKVADADRDIVALFARPFVIFVIAHVFGQVQLAEFFHAPSSFGL